jgi:hypothetical protein
MREDNWKMGTSGAGVQESVTGLLGYFREDYIRGYTASGEWVQ